MRLCDMYIVRNVISVYPFCFLSDEGPMLETLDYTIRIGSTPTFLYFDLYLYSAYAAHYVYIHIYPGAPPRGGRGGAAAPPMFFRV